MRFSTSKGTFYGRYSGDSPDGIKILDSSGNEIIVPRKGLIKDSVVAQGEVIEIKAVDNVAAYNGRYLAETDTEIYLDVDGKVTKLSKNNLDLTTLQKKEFAEELGVPPVSAEAGVGLGEQILDVLPADFKRETSAVYKSEGLFELNGKIYRRGSEGNWKQKREGFWSFLGDKDISDEEYFDVAEELNIAESNAFPQKTAAKVPSETYSAPEVFTGGQMVPDKEIAEFFDNADINCPTGGALVGQAAAGPCNFEISTGRKRLSNLKEGDEVRLVSLRGNHYYGEFIFADENTLLLRLPDSTQNQIRLDRIDLNSLVSQDNFVRIIRTDGTSAFGKYAGKGKSISG